MAAVIVIKPGDINKELELSRKISEGAIVISDNTDNQGIRTVSISEAVNITM